MNKTLVLTKFERALMAALFAGTLSLSAADVVEVFNGKDLSGWRKPIGDWVVARAVSLDPTNSEKLVITPGEGIMVNGPKGKAKDFVTEKEFADAEIHVEFCVSKHSNSGVYVMGRYEIQIYDSYGVEK